MNIQNLDMTAGESRTFTMNARNPSNAVQSLSGLTVTWRVGRGPYDPNSRHSVFTKAGTITSAANGTFTVSVEETDTDCLLGDFTHQAVTSDNVVVVSGRLHIRPALMST